LQPFRVTASGHVADLGKLPMSCHTVYFVAPEDESFIHLKHVGQLLATK